MPSSHLQPRLVPSHSVSQAQPPSDAHSVLSQSTVSAGLCLSALLHCRVLFCSPSAKLTAEAHNNHVCRTREQNSWLTWLVMILPNKKPLKGPSATSLEKPFPVPQGLNFPIGSHAHLYTSVGCEVRCTTTLPIIRTFFKNVVIVIKVCIPVSEMLKHEKKKNPMYLRIEKCIIFLPAPSL